MDAEYRYCCKRCLLGKRIADEKLQGENKAEYGKEIIKRLADYLTNLYGKGFTKSNLYQFVQFYKFFPDIFHAVSGKSQILSWTHYRNLLRITDKMPEIGILTNL